MSRAIVRSPMRQMMPARKRKTGAVTVSATPKEKRSEMRPISVGAAASPRLWASRRANPTAVALILGATMSCMTALSGPVQKFKEMAAITKTVMKRGRV